MQSKGGRARAEALSAEERREIARRAALARWADTEGQLPKAVYEGELKIGDMAFPCSVLSDGTRILTQSDFMTGMGMYYSGWVAKNRPAEDISAEVPHFLSFSKLKPFVAKHLGDLQSIVVKYRTVRGTIAHGIKAEIIPKICEIWLDADEQTNLGVRQKKIAAKAKILMRALAHVGIIALVDEATGYQKDRARDALAKILEEFIAKELRKWVKTFPAEFYQELFRLRNLNYNGTSVKRPQYIGVLTNDLVYSRLAPGVLDELRRQTPRDEKGRLKHHLHRKLTDDVGHPRLLQHLSALTALMKACDKWDQFKAMVDRALPKYRLLPLFDNLEPENEA